MGRSPLGLTIGWLGGNWVLGYMLDDGVGSCDAARARVERGSIGACCWIGGGYAGFIGKPTIDGLPLFNSLSDQILLKPSTSPASPLRNKTLSRSCIHP